MVNISNYMFQCIKSKADIKDVVTKCPESTINNNIDEGGILSSRTTNSNFQSFPRLKFNLLLVALIILTGLSSIVCMTFRSTDDALAQLDNIIEPFAITYIHEVIDDVNTNGMSRLSPTLYLSQRNLQRHDGEPTISYPSMRNLDCCSESFESGVNNLNSLSPNLRGSNTWNSRILEASGGGVPPAVQYIAIILLLMLSAIFAGLTLGFLSLDLNGLEIVMAGEDARLARAAKTIYPIRKNGNLLLITLILGNVGVNSLLSILMADLTSGLVAFLTSTASIVVFGEIIPQAICSRFPLQVGEKAVPLVKFFMILLGVIAYPLAFILNKVMGREIGTSYSVSEMVKLIELQVKSGHFQHETGAAMTGALRYHGMSVLDVMTPLNNTFMLSADERLGFDTVAKIFKTGYSRIPVYEVSKSNVIGLLFVKDLIFLDPEDEIPVKNFVQIFGRNLHEIWVDDKLGDVLKLLKKGRSHMALVKDVNKGDGTLDPYYEIKGIITLEDIIEIILGDEIVDETDELVEVNDPKSFIHRSEMGDFIEGLDNANDNSESTNNVRTVRCSNKALVHGVDWESRLRLLDERLVNEFLSLEEVRAVAAHLKTNYPKAVELISDKQLRELLASSPVTRISPALTCSASIDDLNDDNWLPTDSGEYLYMRGVPANFCTIVLTGKLAVISGSDKFRSDVSNWGVIATKALSDPSYVPDFSAWVPHSSDSVGCRCVKLDRRSFFNAVDNTALEKTGHDVGDETSRRSVQDSDHSLELNPQIELHNDEKRKANSGSPLERSDKNCKSDAISRTHGIAPPQSVTHNQAFLPSHITQDDKQRIQNRRNKLMNAFQRAEDSIDERSVLSNTY